MCIYWQLKTAQHNPTIDNDPIYLVQSFFLVVIEVLLVTLNLKYCVVTE